MKTANRFTGIIFEEKGAVAVIVAILAIVLLGFAAFAVDLPNLLVAKGELQNAADAGALAGARYLYNDDGLMVNAGANAIVSDAAMANFSQRAPVEVESVERGHWSFATETFTVNESLEPVDLWNTSTDELDANINFINAVKVRVGRSSTQVPSFFARIFGREGFTAFAEATAYIGFAGTVEPGEFDMPIAICKQAILQNDEYSCNIGRMLNSGGNTATSNTAGWTNFSQSCDTANASEMRQILDMACGGDGANVDTVSFGEAIGSTGGVQDNVFRQLADCWENSSGDGIPDQPWALVMPVVDCPGNNVGNCSEVKGAVTVNVVWIFVKEPNNIAEASCAEIPCKMGEWPEDEDSISDNGQERWDSFVQYFALKNADDQPAPIAKKSIYFLPDCTPHPATGTTGGENYGIRAEIPVLVQ
jgi:Flp pilus assembly protein TadG